MAKRKCKCPKKRTYPNKKVGGFWWTLPQVLFAEPFFKKILKK